MDKEKEASDLQAEENKNQEEPTPIEITEDTSQEETEELGTSESEEPQTDMESTAEDEVEANENGAEETVDEELDPNRTVGEAIEDSQTSSESDVFTPDPEIDAAVDDIVRTESDEVIAETDAKLAAAAETKSKRSFGQRLKGGLQAWWNNRPARYGTFAGLIAIVIVAALLPVARYGVLNALGVRVISSMTVIDSQTRLPLKNINVSLQDQSGQTDEDGKISFHDLKLGKSVLSITKIGYAENSRDIVLGWGSNPIGDQELIATGEQFTFILRDWLNDQPITDAEASAGENSAKADDNGKIVLTVGQESIADVEILINAEGYRKETLGTQELTDGETELKLVPSRRHAFVSTRNGEYDLYVIDLDGKNEELLLEATGSEREVPVVLAHPTRNTVAYVSSRDGDQNSGGFVLDGLFIVDTENGDSERIARSEQLQLIGWHKGRLVFMQVVEGTSRSNPERSKLISYDTVTKERLELASANYFNDVRLVNGTVYYAVSSFAVPQSQAKLYTVSADGGNATKLLDMQVYSIFRSAYDRLVFQAIDQKWFEQVGGGDVEDIGPQTQPDNHRFSDAPNGEKTAWVETRDGKGVLLLRSTKDTQTDEQQLLSLPGLDSIQYWVNDHTLVFRIIRSGETADYVVNIDRPQELKIVDVTASTRIYY